jgi:quercetin dioxygenase-like cupin family protein
MGFAEGTAIVRNGDSDAGREALPGFRLRTLADHSTGCNTMAVRLAELDPGVPGTQWHIHEFDQFYFVLEGLLMVEVANKRFAVEPLSLVALPAGIPHRNWNGGDRVERHVAILVPEPARGVPADIAVAFSTVIG